jgi:integrase
VGRPLFRSTFAWRVWHAAVARAGLDGFTFHGLRHRFVAILVGAGCNVREVSEWAGHNSVAFTLTRYRGLSKTVRPSPLRDALKRRAEVPQPIAAARERLESAADALLDRAGR